MEPNNQGPTVFDINKPNTYGAQPSSRPVINNQPAVPDPMVTPTTEAGEKIDVKVGATPAAGVDPDALANSLFAEPVEIKSGVPSEAPAMQGEPLQSPPFRPDGDDGSSAQRAPYMPVSDLTGITSSSTPTASPMGNEASEQQITTGPKPGVFGSHSSHAMDGSHEPPKPKKKSKGWLWLIIALIVIVGGYLAVDKFTSVSLPFNVFNKEEPAAAGDNNPAPPASTVPSGFTTTKLVEAGLSFAYPTDWGTPSAAVDQGFTKRTKDGKADTPFAYVVDFPNNKDVELAVTSGKVLPPNRTTPKYYDLLGWCIGSVDSGKYFANALYATTDNNTETPSTVACTSALNSVTKLTEDTIVQTGLPANNNSKADVYTKNLKNANFVVAHVVDASQKNADQIKTMLGSFENL